MDIEKRNKRQYAWQKENRERINILLELGTKDRIAAAAEKINVNSSELIRQAINEKIDKIEAAAADLEAKEIKIETKYY